MTSCNVDGLALFFLRGFYSYFWWYYTLDRLAVMNVPCKFVRFAQEPSSNYPAVPKHHREQSDDQPAQPAVIYHHYAATTPRDPWSWWGPD